ncbi:hypothetical protein [Clostridium gasigenes]|uniref:Uncharacterized protein n=1 Tax=Clostridium gasigenes TaxID=94869 RepID=A0A7X0S9Y6_9CLOT|nr:hypothetical protein [Clostridium gasigenes]MBB6713720.1 hypothetical protein [Clostridium gasigenes]
MKASASKGIWIPEELWQNEDLIVNEEIIEKKSFVSVLKNKSGQAYDNNFKHKESYKDYEEEGWEGDEPF